jgi:hypothetical protein
VKKKLVHNPQATNDALSILRSGENFNFYVIFLLVLVLFIYFSEIKKKNWNAIAAGLALYMVHWLAEIINALWQPLTGHALWTIPTGTAFLILIGVGIELSLMFAIAGLAVSRLLPDDPNEKIMGLPNKIGRIGVALANAALASIIEIFLVMTPTFVWVWEYWNALTVFIFVYIPFFFAAVYAYYWKPKKQKTFIGSLALVNILLLIIFAGILQII